MRVLLSALLLLACALPPALAAPALDVRVQGVDSVLEANVRAHVGSRLTLGADLVNSRRRARLATEAERAAGEALKPYGYYAPSVSARLEPNGSGKWLLTLLIEPGVAVTVRSARIEITGPGQDEKAFRDWLRDWPLREGARLDQPAWEAAKNSLMELAAEGGYLAAEFTQREIALDLEGNAADLALVMDTGPAAVMGSVRFEQDQVEEGVLRSIPRFEVGDRYRPWLVDRLRADLWRMGYFEEVVVAERPDLERDPPVVDVNAVLTPRKPHTQRVTVGYGTDTEFRFQYRWDRHRLSERGDSLGVGAGWQQRYKEVLGSVDYRLPRQRTRPKFWVGNGTFRSESLDLSLTDDVGGEPVFIGSGRIEGVSLTGGHLTLRHVADSREPISETLFAEYLVERNNFDRLLGNGRSARLPGDAPDEDFGLGERTRTLVLGARYDWPVIEGRGFATVGHHERAWLLLASEALGSDRSFTQAYVSSRWNRLLGQRWKLLLRGEAGYTRADVSEFELVAGDRVLQLSLTDLPFRYRFRAGGSQSVRGYDFDALSNNGLGSNHILTASAELEFKVHGDWAAAAFYDVGNAFNRWSERNLKAGAGVGLRWYTIAGAVRLDYARALDISGEPWQIHLTIGTPLL